MKLILLCFWIWGTSSFSCSVSWGIGLFKSKSLTGVGACSTAFETSFRGRCLLHLLMGLAAGAVVVSCPKTLARRWSMSILSGVLSSGSTPGISESSGQKSFVPPEIQEHAGRWRGIYPRHASNCRTHDSCKNCVGKNPQDPLRVRKQRRDVSWNVVTSIYQ